MRARELQAYLSDERGASAAEFALVAILFFGLILGIIGICLALYANSTLQFAVADAARCMSVKTDICPDAGSTQVYAAANYAGPGISPHFTASYSAINACAHIVSATASFPLNAGIVNFNIPLSASACYP